MIRMPKDKKGDKKMQSIFPTTKFKPIKVDLDVGMKIARKLMKENKRTLRLLKKL